ncbi:autotransporter outer membrane beta-barrel domain-containing protein [Prodigiosinella confusarubida]|uniref:Autotransporter outer membrane beta-barrel domain-containing protein n=2 Tax=Serratia sp. (strain ATCC 39006) TaxID=104623 RepID=A0A2I5TA66_SERS3|nr:autotransporter outer membrane beta-barrel domain-containing protein [Serratia sp. ATCC 39006]AUH05766.1 autotransporter outer membrane beta-barrel domain-containing protein [Serratia sp. ATCC 39006]
MRPATFVAVAVALGAIPAHSASRAGNNAINGVDLLSGFSKLWNTGATWNTGTPTALGAPLLAYNIQYVIDRAHTRTEQQEIAAYYDDRRNQSYSVINGLGSLTNGYLAGSGAFTTIPVFDDTTKTVQYNDAGNGAGNSDSALGNVVRLVLALRNDASTTPAKNHYLYPRPWRQTDEDIVADSLKPERSTTPASDSGFPSGHTNAAYLSSIALAYAIPERFDSLLLRASQLGDNRIEAGMHSPLDVIGGRITATYFAIDNLSNSDNTQLKADSRAQALAYFTSQCGGDINNCVERVDPATDRFSAHSQDKATYTDRMTYGFTPIGPTNLAPVVPLNAEVLLETRFPYLGAAQRRDILASTEISSGYVVIDESGGYGRLNLFAAGDGYGAFNNTVTVDMRAEQGGFNARDAWRNDISGSGGLVKQGTGELILSGDNTYSGGTVVEGGTLTGYALAFGSGTITIGDNGTLKLDQSVDGSMDNILAGQGALIKTGVGSLNLTADSGFTGITQVRQGRLAVNGSLARSAVTVNSGATLGGNGTVGSTHIESGGILAPGNSVGLLTVNGDLNLDAGSIYQVQVTPAGVADRVNVAGVANINGAQLSLDVSQLLDPLAQLQILRAAGGVSGVFASPVLFNTVFLNLVVQYGAQDIALNLVRNNTAFADVVTNPNQRSTAQGIESLGVGNSLWNQVALSDTAGARDVFSSLTDEIHASTNSALIQLDQTVTNAMRDRLWSAQMHAKSHDRLAPEAQDRQQADLGQDSTVWLQVPDGSGHIGSTAATGRLNTDAHAVLVGADMPVNSVWRLGGLLGGGRSSANIDGRSGSSDSNNIHVGLYSDAQWGAFSLKTGATYGRHDINASRMVNYTGVPEHLDSDYRAASMQAFAELGYDIGSGSTFVQPFVGVDHTHLRTGGFSESGSAAALNARRQNNDVSFSTIGVHLASSFLLGQVQVLPYATLGWRNALGNTDIDSREAFTGGDDFTLVGAPLARHVAILSGGAEVVIGKRVSVGINYAAQIANNATDHNVKAVLTIHF